MQRTRAFLTTAACACALLSRTGFAQPPERDETIDDEAPEFAREGVVEVGGGAGMMLSSDFRMISVIASFGQFVRDNIEVSMLLGVASIEAMDDTETLVTALVEPSYHVPLSDDAFAFAGAGVGAVVLDDRGTGLAVAPRIGARIRVGRAGMLSPSLTYQHVFNNLDDAEMQGAALDAALDSLRVDLAFTAFW